MSKHYKFDAICYLAIDTSLPGVTNETTKENVRWAITEWLRNKSGTDDVIFIFFATHGIGHNCLPVFDADGDEGNETRETTIGIDVNGDGNVTDDWVGIDEALLTRKLGGATYENYTDDEFALDLGVLDCSELIFATTACYSGGFIDDISNSNKTRIIMTAANETDPAARAGYDNQMSPWASNFMDALHGEVVYWDPITDQLIHKGLEVDADSDHDGHVSLFEAWNYSWYNNPARLNGQDIPWLDDNGNGLPTYINETDHLDGTDGSLANNTWFPRRHYNLTVKTRTTSGSEISDVKVWIDGSLEYSPIIAHDMTAENHNVTVESTIYLNGYEYQFSFWEDDSTNNSRMLHIHENKTITAYYHIQAQGCPFVSTWNGTEFVIDNNLLANSAKSGGTEVEDYYKLEQSLVSIGEWNDQSIYSLLLSEFQQEHSYFDQAQLIVVDHESGVSVAVSPFGEVLTYQNPYVPLSAVDDQGQDQIELIRDIDDSYCEGYNGSYLLLNFGIVEAENAELVMRADRPPSKRSIHIQVLDATENWMDVVAIIPRTYWATEIIDLSSYLPSTGGFKVRLYFTDNHKVDYVGLDTTPQAQIDVEDAQLLLAYHSDEGNVTTKLLFDDDVYAELTPGQQMILLFSNTKQNEKQRIFIIYVKGYYITITG